MSRYPKKEALFDKQIDKAFFIIGNKYKDMWFVDMKDLTDP